MIIHQEMFNSRGGGSGIPREQNNMWGKIPLYSKIPESWLKIWCLFLQRWTLHTFCFHLSSGPDWMQVFTPCSSHEGQKVTRWGKKDIGSHTMISGTRNVSQEVPSLVLICSPRGTARSGPVDIPHVASWFSNIHLINSFVASSKFIVKHSNRRKTTKNRR